MRDQHPSPWRNGSGARPGGPGVLARFLQQYREELVWDWEAALHARRPEGLPGGSLLRDTLPELLEAMAAEHPPTAPSAWLTATLSEEQLRRRLEMGYAPENAVLEYGLLRQCLLEGLTRTGYTLEPDVLPLLDEAVYQGITHVITLHTQVREQRLEALERVSQAALSSEDLDSFLPRLLHVLMETVATVDGASILLREGDRLRLRAAVGVGAEQALAAHVDLPLDQSYTGHVATERHPLSLRSVSTYPELGYEALRQLGLRGAYSVPLLHGETVVGVAHMASRTLFDFSESDKLLFRTMLTRATGFIVQAELAERERSARAEAQRLLAQVDTLLKAAPVGIALMDRELHYLSINNTLAGINGRDVAGHLGKTFREVVPAWVADALEPVFLHILETGQPISNHEFVTHPQGEQGPPCHWLGNYYPVRTRDGEVLGLGCVVVDITHQKKVETELRRSGEVREQLIGVLGHDLRNPLNAISASAYLLQHGEPLSPHDQRALERIRTSAGRMARMLSDILDFARSSLGGGLPVHREWVDLGEICVSTLEEFQVTHPGRALELEVRGDTRGEWDSDRLAQVVGNLVSNALRYGQPNTPARVEVHGAGGEVHLSVHNAGEPIPPELQAQLFQPFHAGTTGKAATRSVGLGLYIVRQIAHAHGGEVEVHSAPGAGTTFRVRLPRHETKSPSH